MEEKEPSRVCSLISLLPDPDARGRDDHGQLPPPGVPRIESIAVESEHVVAFTDEREVVPLGVGEHGNCGPQNEKFRDVKGR